MTKKKTEPEKELEEVPTEEAPEEEVTDYPKCIRCSSTKLYWVRPSVSRDQGSGKSIPKRLGCRVCGDKWDVAA